MSVLASIITMVWLMIFIQEYKSDKRFVDKITSEAPFLYGNVRYTCNRSK